MPTAPAEGSETSTPEPRFWHNPRRLPKMAGMSRGAIRMLRFIVGLTLVCLLNASVANAATLIYGSVFAGPGEFSALWAFAPAGTPPNRERFIGAIGFQRVGAIDFSPGGTLYGVGFDGANAVLITINTTIGAGTRVGSLGQGNLFVQDIAFRPSDGALFAFAEGFIFTINTTTGAATVLGDAGIGFPFGNSLAFQGTTLYYANESDLYTINQTTGVATLVHPMVYQGFGTAPRPPAMKFEAGTGTLWASVVGGSGGNFRDTLATIDLATGKATALFLLPVTTDGIAVTSGALPAAGASVPTLSEWAQIVLVSVMVLVGLAALRRRRPA